MNSNTTTASLHKLPGGDLLSVPGFSGAGISCGIKPEGALDLALIDAGRKVIRFHMGEDIIAGLKNLSEWLT